MTIPDEGVGYTPSGTAYATDERELSIEGLTYAESLDGRLVIPVPNTTARDALVTAFSPSSTRPLVVLRADAPTDAKVEYTTDGTTWYALGRPPVVTSGTLIAGTYAGQPIRTKYINGSVTTDSNGDVIVLPLADYSGGGILTAHLSGASTFDIVAAFRIDSGNLVARLWDSGTVKTSVGVAVTGKVEYFKAS